MKKSLAEELKRAKPEVLQEIVREAESRLAAQLSTALAADMRAMTFLGFIAAVVVAAIGFALTTFDYNRVLSMITLLIGAGFTVAAGFAFEAARPIDFHCVGNNPDQWVLDIQNGISLHDALAEQAQHYSEMLNHNREAMEVNSQALFRSAKVVLGTVVIGGLLVIGYLTGVIPSDVVAP